MSGRGRRERMSSDVMSGFERQWARISEPIKPDVPASIYFMFVLSERHLREKREVYGMS